MPGRGRQRLTRARAACCLSGSPTSANLERVMARLYAPSSFTGPKRVSRYREALLSSMPCSDDAGAPPTCRGQLATERADRVLLGYDGRGRPRPEVDLRSDGLRCLWAAAGGPAPQGGTADSASAKVPSAASPRNASAR